MGRKLSPANDEIDPALVRELLAQGDQRLVSEDDVAKVRASIVEAMRAAGVRPALVHAYERTGLIVTQQNRHLMSAADLDEWEDAIAEYEELQPVRK